MFDNFDHPKGGSHDDEAFDILQELEQSTPDEIRRQRTHDRIAVKARVTVQPGNASQLLDFFKIPGTTGDISALGLGTLFPAPIQVGDIYRLEFDQNKLPLPLTFARCVRCRLVRDDAYEVGFLFFVPIQIPENLGVAGGV